jgi:hypothetical protein
MSRGTADPNTPIICRLTPWYYRRMGLLAALFLGTGIYFFYDGRVGYPRENLVALQKTWFETEVIEGPQGYDAAAKLGEDMRQAWVKAAREKAWIVSPSLDEPRWKDYAASRGWAENPKYHSEDEIRQQFYWGAGMVVVAVVAGFMVLLNHNKVFTGHADHMVMPNGVSVRYADAYCVDKRKWDNKGLAYVHYREAEGAPSHRVTVDDLKYGGAEKVLNRLLAQFKGELIEKPSGEEEQPAEPEPRADMDVPQQESPPKA